MSETTIQFQVGNIIFDERNTPVYEVCAKGIDSGTQEAFYSVRKLPTGKPAVISEKDLIESVTKLQTKFDELSSSKKEFYHEYTQHNHESEKEASEKLKAFFIQEFGESFTRCFDFNSYKWAVKQLGTNYGGARAIGYEKEVPSVLKLDSKHPYSEGRGWSAPAESPGSIFVSKEGYAKLAKLATVFRAHYEKEQNKDRFSDIEKAFTKFLKKQKHWELIKASGFRKINPTYSPSEYDSDFRFPVILREDFTVVIGGINTDFKVTERSTEDIIKKLDEWKEKILSFEKIREEIKSAYDGKNVFDFISHEDTIQKDEDEE